MDDDARVRQIILRLDVLIALQLETLGGQDASRTRTKIQHLSKLGLSPSDVAAILGKKTNYVTATLAQQKKREKGKVSVK